MRKTLLLLFVVVVLAMFVPLTATAASSSDAVVSNQNSTGSVVENIQNEADISIGLPKVTEQDALNKATKITGKIHGLASQVMPEITLVILVIGAVLGIFWGEARRMVLFAIVALVVVLWAPFLISLAVNLLNV